MTKEEVDAILQVCDELDIEPPWDYHVNLRGITLCRAISDVMNTQGRRDEDQKTEDDPDVA
jgi:hypothetical protein